ncbi:MAG: hypothetical protein M1331_01175 [Candidatus Marsarchaeota archaeon]|nr:hypothetical protein [Candidatus Marsarchaeota archaeon]MCL5105995.1 hypothetical protein [Candidatus Marsarchaeota archaeon]
MEKIVIRVIERPSDESPEKIIKWFCVVFGLSDNDNGNDIGVQILKKFIMDSDSRKSGLSSSDLKLSPRVPKSTAIYHLNRFISSGLIVKKGRKYYLRATNLLRAIEEIEYDIDKEFRKMLDTAMEFDRMFSIPKKSSKIRRGYQ